MAWRLELARSHSACPHLPASSHPCGHQLHQGLLHTSSPALVHTTHRSKSCSAWPCCTRATRQQQLPLLEGRHLRLAPPPCQPSLLSQALHLSHTHRPWPQTVAACHPCAARPQLLHCRTCQMCTHSPCMQDQVLHRLLCSSSRRQTQLLYCPLPRQQETLRSSSHHWALGGVAAVCNRCRGELQLLPLSTHKPSQLRCPAQVMTPVPWPRLSATWLHKHRLRCVL